MSSSPRPSSAASMRSPLGELPTASNTGAGASLPASTKTPAATAGQLKSPQPTPMTSAEAAALPSGIPVFRPRGLARDSVSDAHGGPSMPGAATPVSALDVPTLSLAKVVAAGYGSVANRIATRKSQIASVATAIPTAWATPRVPSAGSFDRASHAAALHLPSPGAHTVSGAEAYAGGRHHSPRNPRSAGSPRSHQRGPGHADAPTPRRNEADRGAFLEQTFLERALSSRGSVLHASPPSPTTAEAHNPPQSAHRSKMQAPVGPRGAPPGRVAQLAATMKMFRTAAIPPRNAMANLGTAPAPPLSGTQSTAVTLMAPLPGMRPTPAASKEATPGAPEWLSLLSAMTPFTHVSAPSRSMAGLPLYAGLHALPPEEVALLPPPVRSGLRIKAAGAGTAMGTAFVICISRVEQPESGPAPADVRSQAVRNSSNGGAAVALSPTPRSSKDAEKVEVALYAFANAKTCTATVPLALLDAAGAYHSSAAAAVAAHTVQVQAAHTGSPARGQGPQYDMVPPIAKRGVKSAAAERPAHPLLSSCLRQGAHGQRILGIVDTTPDDVLEWLQAAVQMGSIVTGGALAPSDWPALPPSWTNEPVERHGGAGWGQRAGVPDTFDAARVAWTPRGRISGVGPGSNRYDVLVVDVNVNAAPESSSGSTRQRALPGQGTGGGAARKPRVHAAPPRLPSPTFMVHAFDVHTLQATQLPVRLSGLLRQHGACGREAAFEWLNRAGPVVLPVKDAAAVMAVASRWRRWQQHIVAFDEPARAAGVNAQEWAAAVSIQRYVRGLLRKQRLSSFSVAAQNAVATAKAAKRARAHSWRLVWCAARLFALANRARWTVARRSHKPFPLACIRSLYGDLPAERVAMIALLAAKAALVAKERGAAVGEAPAAPLCTTPATKVLRAPATPLPPGGAPMPSPVVAIAAGQHSTPPAAATPSLGAEAAADVFALPPEQLWDTLLTATVESGSEAVAAHVLTLYLVSLPVVWDARYDEPVDLTSSSAAALASAGSNASHLVLYEPVFILRAYSLSAAALPGMLAAPVALPMTAHADCVLTLSQLAALGGSGGLSRLHETLRALSWHGPFLPDLAASDVAGSKGGTVHDVAVFAHRGVDVYRSRYEPWHAAWSLVQTAQQASTRVASPLASPSKSGARAFQAASVAVALASPGRWRPPVLGASPAGARQPLPASPRVGTSPARRAVGDAWGTPGKHAGSSCGRGGSRGCSGDVDNHGSGEAGDDDDAGSVCSLFDEPTPRQQLATMVAAADSRCAASHLSPLPGGLLVHDGRCCCWSTAARAKRRVLVPPSISGEPEGRRMEVVHLFDERKPSSSAGREAYRIRTYLAKSLDGTSGCLLSLLHLTADDLTFHTRDAGVDGGASGWHLASGLRRPRPSRFIAEAARAAQVLRWMREDEAVAAAAPVAPLFGCLPRRKKALNAGGAGAASAAVQRRLSMIADVLV